MTLSAEAVLTLPDFLAHWRGHRALTRRVIAAFPEDQLFAFTAAPMRPFGEMATELYFVAGMTLSGLCTGAWPEPDWASGPRDKAALLQAWDLQSERLETEFSAVAPEAFSRVHHLPWGDMPGWVAATYAVDNEIHHRAQGYVYLRALGIEPPAFYER